ncbi:CpsD/CapB family tyrosine-protein kinase [Pseudoroseicyclus sp. H15]
MNDASDKSASRPPLTAEERQRLLDRIAAAKRLKAQQEARARAEAEAHARAEAESAAASVEAAAEPAAPQNTPGAVQPEVHPESAPVETAPAVARTEPETAPPPPEPETAPEPWEPEPDEPDNEVAQAEPEPEFEVEPEEPDLPEPAPQPQRPAPPPAASRPAPARRPVRAAERPRQPAPQPVAFRTAPEPVDDFPEEPEQPAAPEPAPEALAAPPAQNIEAAWEALPQFPVNERALARNLVITARRDDPAHAAFDILRARMVKAMHEHGWHRIGITSPGPGVGKSFTSVNLAITLSRYDNTRTMLIEADLRRPGLSRYLGIDPDTSTGDFLRGETAPEDFFRRPAANRLHIGRNLAVGLNGKVEPFASELFQQPKTEEVLADMAARYRPDVLLFDLPPALAQDDVIALAPHFDCVLLVIGGDRTDAAEVRETQRRLGEDMPIIGIVLNKGETSRTEHYGY